MENENQIKDYNRIEDFIVFSNQGNKVSATVDLRKEIVTQKVHPEVTSDRKSDLDMYLLFVDYTFTVGSNTKTISKSYMYGSTVESLNEAKINENIANERLKMDYNRLKSAKIKIEEKLF